jgi:phage terminase large subunit GpA-like protein
MITSAVLKALLSEARQKLIPVEKIAPSVWAVKYRRLAAMTAEMAGEWSWAMFPHMRAIIDTFFEAGVRGIRCMKSSQAGWSETVATLLGYIIDMMPAPIIVLFPKEKKAKDFDLERFEPMVRETPKLAEKIELTSRAKGITQTRKFFAGGFLKFVHSHSADEVKSSSARYGFVEEPDECDRDVRGQGSTVKLLIERLKQYFDTFSVMGGSPTLTDLSAIEDEMKLTDKRVWYAPCHRCNERVPLDGNAWPLVKWKEDETLNHPVYGRVVVESAYMVCPHCGGAWSDAERARNSRLGLYIATAPFTGIAGFYVSDLMSSAPGASLPRLVEKYLEAKHKEAAGDLTGLIEFHNNQLGLAFKYKSPAPDVEELARRAEDYPELTVPWGGLRLSCGVDIQGNRIALVVVAWGRGEESWRVYWGEIFGNPVDRDDPVWTELESFLSRPYRHASGAELHIEKTTIDSGDGNTSDAVYWFCRKHKGHGVMAGKGVETGEIFRVPKPVDPSRLSKANRYGLLTYQVGTEKAKDLIIGFGEHGGRLRLSEKNLDGAVVTGRGPGRMHWYRDIREDYFSGVTSEVKAPMKGRPRGKLYWQVKQSVRNEPLDCEVYALHASRVMKVNLMTEAQWSDVEKKLRQPDLVGIAAQANPATLTQSPPLAEEPISASEAVPETPAPQRPAARRDAIAAQFESDPAAVGGMSQSPTPY